MRHFFLRKTTVLRRKMKSFECFSSSIKKNLKIIKMRHIFLFYSPHLFPLFVIFFFFVSLKWNTFRIKTFVRSFFFCRYILVEREKGKCIHSFEMNIVSILRGTHIFLFKIPFFSRRSLSFSDVMKMTRVDYTRMHTFIVLSCK